MQADDRARLVVILESSGEAVLYAGSRSGPELEEDRMVPLCYGLLIQRGLNHAESSVPWFPWLWRPAALGAARPRWRW